MGSLFALQIPLIDTRGIDPDESFRIREPKIADCFLGVCGDCEGEILYEDVCVGRGIAPCVGYCFVGWDLVSGEERYRVEGALD